LGAMVFGGVAEERLQLNESTVWAGGPHDYTNPEALAALPEIRRLVFAGKWAEAEAQVSERFMSRPLRQPPYQTVGSLLLTFAPEGGAPRAVTNYRRELDLDLAIVRTTYELGGVRYSREVFASVPDQVIVAHLTADRPGQVA